MKYEELTHGDSFYDDGIKYTVTGKPTIVGKRVTVCGIDKNDNDTVIEIDLNKTVPLTRKASL